MFFLPEEVGVVDFVEFFFSFFCISAGWLEGWRVGVECWNIFEWVANNIAPNAKFVGEFSNNRAYFLRYRFILLFSGKEYVSKISKVSRVMCTSRRGR